MASPDVTVVIPVLDASDTLPAALASVAAQTVTAAETMVVDCGPARNGMEILETLPLHVRVVRRPHRCSTGSSCLFGATLAKSPWVAFLRADDIWYPERLERQLAQVTRYPNIDAVVGQAMPLVNSGDAVVSIERPALSTLLIDRARLLKFSTDDHEGTLLDELDFVERLVEQGVRVLSIPDRVARVARGG